MTTLSLVLAALIITPSLGGPVYESPMADLVATFMAQTPLRCPASQVCDSVLLNFQLCATSIIISRRNCTAKNMDNVTLGNLTYNIYNLENIYTNDFMFSDTYSHCQLTATQSLCEINNFTLNVTKTPKGMPYWFEFRIRANTTDILKSFEEKFQEALIKQSPILANISYESWLEEYFLFESAANIHSFFESSEQFGNMSEEEIYNNLSLVCQSAWEGGCNVSVLSLGTDFTVKANASVLEADSPMHWKPEYGWTTPPETYSVYHLLIDGLRMNASMHNSTKCVHLIRNGGFYNISNTVRFTFNLYISVECWMKSGLPYKEEEVLKQLQKDMNESYAPPFKLLINYTNVEFAVPPTTTTLSTAATTLPTVTTTEKETTIKPTETEQPITTVPKVPTTTTAASRLFTTSIYSMIGAVILIHLTNFLSHLV